MKLHQILASLALALGIAGTARAQCATPDGLDPLLPACAPGSLTANDHAFGQKTLGICWRQCGIDATAPYVALWSQLYPSITTAGTVDCGWYTVRVQLLQGMNARWAGVLNAHYSRTWYEGTPAAQYQVWRYLVNGDLRPLSNAAGPCGLPPCAVPNNRRVRFTGYIDYAFNCANGQMETAWMLTHGCDSIDHAASFPRGGSYHPDRYYTFVGPSTSFVPGVSSGVESGFGALESVRRWDLSAAVAQCQHDEPLLQATITPSQMTCLCSAGAPMWYEAALSGMGLGGTSFSTLPGQADFKSVTIGAWTNPWAYPGQEEVRWNTSTLAYTDGCTGNTQLEYFFGVTTQGGFTAYNTDSSGMIVLLPPTFVDQSCSKKFPSGLSVRNVPFRSDHVLNLNL